MMPDLILVRTKGLKTNRNLLSFICFIFCCQTYLTKAQDTIPNRLGILFYNVENLFDAQHDSLKEDNEFLPESVRHWTTKRYNDKISKVSRVIYESGGWNPPCLIGLCEIENDKVLKDLIFKTGLINLQYQYIHFESKDVRGIDVALLFRKDIFTPVKSEPIAIDLEDDRPTRDLLYVQGILSQNILIHILICHFPSRYGGVMETENKRLKASETLVTTVKKITDKNPSARIVIMGDFNDGPNDNCMKYIIQNTTLINIAQKPESVNHCKGTIKYQYQWNSFDQILVSESLLNESTDLHSNKNMKILDFSFLLEDDTKFTGKKPFRTYNGYKYHEGYSDHLPVWTELSRDQ